jgi:hypothetical protein
MKRLFLLLPLVALAFGCARNHFNIPQETFAKKVRIVGVAPIMIDPGSDIRHPDKDQLLAVVAELNRKYEMQFVRKLKATGSFYAVSLLDADPQKTFDSLFFRREKRDDAAICYNKYFWKTDRLRDYLRQNRLDALLLIVVSGIGRIDSVSSSRFASSLTAEYNYLIMTAQIVDGDGAILWEYPNFRTRLLSYDPLINLQYPDFSEASANLFAKADVKFKTVDGIRRALEQKRKDFLFRETLESDLYNSQFDEMISTIAYDPSDKEGQETPPLQKPAEPPAPAASRPQSPAPPAPTVPPPPPPAAPALQSDTPPATIIPSQKDVIAPAPARR